MHLFKNLTLLLEEVKANKSFCRHHALYVHAYNYYVEIFIILQQFQITRTSNEILK